MVTTRSKTGSLPVAAKVVLPADALDVVSKPAKRVQPARPTIRQDCKLLQLPVEILQEILSLADLIDLLNWSLCCRDLNDWLTSKRSLTIWNDAKDNTSLQSHYFDDAYHGRRSYFNYQSKLKTVELPPCPDSIRPFCYARLLFNEGCVACGRNVPLRCVYTSSGLENMCGRCKKSTLVSRNYLKDIWAREDLPKRFWEAIPFGVPKDWGDGPPGATKPAYDLEASELFLEKYQAYEAAVGFETAALSRYIESEIKKQNDMLHFLAAFRLWPAIRKEVLRNKAYKDSQYERNRKEEIQDYNRAEIVKRSLAEDPQLSEDDVKSAVRSLRVLHKMDQHMSEADWDDLNPAILKESNKYSTSRRDFTSAFNPTSLAFRKALRPYWSDCLQVFKQAEDAPDYAITPTLYEFSKLPALSALYASFYNNPTPSLIDASFDGGAEARDDLQKAIQVDLSRFSEDLLVQLIKKIGGKAKCQKDIAVYLSDPSVLFSCTRCREQFEPGTLFDDHSCTTRRRLQHLNIEDLGEHYDSRDFKESYETETNTGWSTWCHFMPVRSFDDIQLHRDNATDIKCVLASLRSHNVELPNLLTRESLKVVTSDLTFICRDCEVDEDLDRKDCQFKGLQAVLDHLEGTRAKWYDRYNTDNMPARHDRLYIEGMVSKKRTAGRIVKYKELDVE